MKGTLLNNNNVMTLCCEATQHTMTYCGLLYYSEHLQSFLYSALCYIVFFSEEGFIFTLLLDLRCCMSGFG